MSYLRAFLAGFLSTLTFHQGMLALLHAFGWIPRAPYSMEPTKPFQIPAVLSLAFWGGVWGILLWFAIRGFEGSGTYWLLAVVLGAIAPSIVALFVVFPLKGQPVAGGWRPGVFIAAFLLNGAWGIGVALFLRLFHALTTGSAHRSV